ncbi:unnamed protein product [Lota lota]
MARGDKDSTDWVRTAAHKVRGWAAWTAPPVKQVLPACRALVRPAPLRAKPAKSNEPRPSLREILPGSYWIARAAPHVLHHIMHQPKHQAIHNSVEVFDTSISRQQPIEPGVGARDEVKCLNTLKLSTKEKETLE